MKKGKYTALLYTCVVICRDNMFCDLLNNSDERARTRGAAGTYAAQRANNIAYLPAVKLPRDNGMRYDNV